MLGWITQVVVCLPAIFLAIAVVNPKIASADGNTFLLYDDVDAPGYDFGYFDPPTLDWCQNQCRNERQCKAFTYNHRKQVCFLKRNARAPLKRHWGATTGIKVGANRISRKSNRDAPGNDYKSFSPPTLPDCKNLCDEEPNCKAFTFNKSKQVCFLKNKQDPSRVRYNGAITGVKVARNSRPPPTETGDPMPTKNDVTTGTGFAVSNNGLILTNNHVVEQCDAITVRGKGSARIKEIDERNDLALLKIEGETYAAEFSSAAPPQGRSVYALGFPYSGLLSTSVNFTDGVISALSGIGNDSPLSPIHGANTAWQFRGALG